MPQYPSCPACKSSTKPSRRKGLKERVVYRLQGLGMYRCVANRHHRFAAKKAAAPPFVLRTLPYLVIVGFAIPVALMIVFENRVPRSLRSPDSMADSAQTAGSRQTPLSEGEKERRRKEIALRAKELVIWAIAEHRRGTPGIVIVNKIRRDEPAYQLILKDFEDHNVPAPVVEQSLDDWTEGVNVRDIGRKWQEERGIDVRGLIRQAEKEGLPVRRLMIEKDTQQ